MRKRIETLLEELGHFSYRHAWGVIFTVLLTIGASVTQIPRIEVRTSVDEFLIEGDETKTDYDDFLAEFGRDDMVLIALEPSEVFDLEFLTQLRAFHEALEDEVPHVREVKSLINARETRGVDDGLIVGELFEDWPETPEALAAIRARALANPLYVDFILSRNADLTIVTVELEAFSAFFEDADDLTGFDDEDSNEGAAEDAGDLARLSGAQEAEVVKALSAVVDRFNSESFRIYAGGAPILNVRMMTSLVTNIVVFTGLSTCLIGFFLVLVLRRAIGVFIPLSVAILSLITTLGAMGALGIPAMPISEIVPSFLLSIGVGASVHLIAICFPRPLRPPDHHDGTHDRWRPRLLRRRESPPDRRIRNRLAPGHHHLLAADPNLGPCSPCSDPDEDADASGANARESSARTRRPIHSTSLARRRIRDDSPGNRTRR